MKPISFEQIEMNVRKRVDQGKPIDAWQVQVILDEVQKLRSILYLPLPRNKDGKITKKGSCL